MAGFAGSSSVCSSGSSVRKKRKATSSCYDYQDNLNLKKKGKSSQQTSESALDQVKQGIPTDYELEKLAVDVGENWIKLGRRLGVSNAKLKEIDRCHDQMSEKGYQMLIHWSEKNGCDATYQALCDGLLNDLVERRDLAEKFCYIVKNKFEEEQEETYDVYGDTVKDTSTVNGDDDYINTPYFHSDNELQQSGKPVRITSTINGGNGYIDVPYIHSDTELQQSGKPVRITSTINGDNDYIDVPYIHSVTESQQSSIPVRIRRSINGDNGYIDVPYIHSVTESQQSSIPVRIRSTSNGDNDYIDVPYIHSVTESQQSSIPVRIRRSINGDNGYIDVPYIHSDTESQQSSIPVRIRSYSLKRQNKEKRGYLAVVIKHTNYENVMEYKFDYKDMDFDHVIKIVDLKDISDYSLVIVISKRNISTSPVDIQTGDNEFKKIEVQMGDDTCSFTVTIWGDQTSAVDLQVGKKELLKNLEAERGDDSYSITVTFWEDQVRKFKNQLTYIINIQGTKSLSLNSDSKTVQIGNRGESLFEVNSSLATVEVTSISCVGEINRFFRCKKCNEKVVPCQGNLQQCTLCQMKQLNNDKDKNISVRLFLSEPELLLTIFQDQLDNIVKLYNEENNENNRLAALTDITLEKIILSVSNVKIQYDKNTKIVTDILKM